LNLAQSPAWERGTNFFPALCAFRFMSLSIATSLEIWPEVFCRSEGLRSAKMSGGGNTALRFTDLFPNEEQR
jgi:hypothetical protein